MTKRHIVSTAFATVFVLAVVGSGSVSAGESVPLPTTATTVVEKFDEVSGIIWSQIDDQTIEISLPD